MLRRIKLLDVLLDKQNNKQKKSFKLLVPSLATVISGGFPSLVKSPTLIVHGRDSWPIQNSTEIANVPLPLSSEFTEFGHCWENCSDTLTHF